MILSRILAISDIHGHSKGMLQLLDISGYEPGKDRLFLLGDYLASSEADSVNTLRLVSELVRQGAQALSGNHELRLLHTPQPADWQREWVPFIASLPLYFNIENYLMVHAGIRPGIPINQQSAVDLTEIREPFLSSPFKLDKPIVFGHTPTSRLGCDPGMVYLANNRIGIDTGAKHGGRLTLVDLTAKLAYSCSTSTDNLYADQQLTSWN
jgi:serine/threonine protein phosphatase 1